LGENQIHSTLIIDQNKTWEVCGFVDVLDVLYHILKVHNPTGDYLELQWESMYWDRTPSYEVSNISEKDPFITVEFTTSLHEILQIFSKGIHRAAVQESGAVGTIISQSDVIEILSRAGIWIGNIVTCTLDELGLNAFGVLKKFIVVADEDLSVRNVLFKMKENKVSGVPIVNKDGKMVGNFSASDLVGLEQSNWFWIGLPVMEFLNKIHRNLPKPPVTVSINNNLEFLLMKYSVHKVSRVYIVNEDFQPIGVITLTDIFQFFSRNLPRG